MSRGFRTREFLPSWMVPLPGADKGAEVRQHSSTQCLSGEMTEKVVGGEIEAEDKGDFLLFVKMLGSLNTGQKGSAVVWQDSPWARWQLELCCSSL